MSFSGLIILIKLFNEHTGLFAQKTKVHKASVIIQTYVYITIFTCHLFVHSDLRLNRGENEIKRKRALPLRILFR